MLSSSRATQSLTSAAITLLGTSALAMIMSTALAGDALFTVDSTVPPLPERLPLAGPAKHVQAFKPNLEERVAEVGPLSSGSAWQRVRQAPRPVVILGQSATPLDKALIQAGRAAAPDGAPWPVLILAATDDPLVGDGTRRVEFDESVFTPDPDYADKPYNHDDQLEIYGGKTAVDTQRPIIELGTPFYDVGPLGQGANFAGRKNLVFGHLYAFGDWRTAVAYNDNGNGDEVAQIATRLNLDVDLGLTATERLHALFQPLQKDGEFTRCEFAGEGSIESCELEFDLEPQTAFFEGDVGAIAAGITGGYNSIDLPFTVGLIPLIFQNGVWLEDAFVGGAAAVPSLNSSTFDISNADITIFGGFDKVTAPGVLDRAGNVADENVNIYGIATFIEALEGYIEAGYAYIDAQDDLDGQDYHSLTAAYTARYGGWLSNSLRAVASFGQQQFGVNRSEDDEEQNGVILLAENSLISSKPYTLLPYANVFLGIGRPVPAADATGLLRNTGINFESDALTDFPFLDDTGQNAYGGAIGVQYLFDLQQQLVFELATTRSLSDVSGDFDQVVDNQYAAGVRYQIPLSNAWLVRADAIFAHNEEDDEDITGIRAELRWKF